MNSFLACFYKSQNRAKRGLEGAKVPTVNIFLVSQDTRRADQTYAIAGASQSLSI